MPGLPNNHTANKNSLCRRAQSTRRFRHRTQRPRPRKRRGVARRQARGQRAKKIQSTHHTFAGWRWRPKLYCTNRREGFQRLPIFISKNSTAVHKASAVLQQEPDPKPTMGGILGRKSTFGGRAPLQRLVSFTKFILYWRRAHFILMGWWRAHYNFIGWRRAHFIFIGWRRARFIFIGWRRALFVLMGWWRARFIFIGWRRAHFIFIGWRRAHFILIQRIKRSRIFSSNPLHQIRSIKSAPLNPLL